MLLSQTDFNTANPNVASRTTCCRPIDYRVLFRLMAPPNDGVVQSTIQRLTVPTAAETAAHAIRDAILLGELLPGERLPEQKWAAKFGIGQPTLREALKELEQLGFVEKTKKRGTYVARLTERDYRDILEVRLPLEAIAVRKVAENITYEIEDELRALILQMANCSEISDLVGFHDADVAFHRRIWDLSENRYLRISLEAICFRLFSVVGCSKNRFRAAVQQHFAILDGLSSHDPAKAELAFLEATLGYWNTQYHVNLCLEDLTTVHSR